MILCQKGKIKNIEKEGDEQDCKMEQQKIIKIIEQHIIRLMDADVGKSRYSDNVRRNTVSSSVKLCKADW